jgi:hypothetical protein
MDVVKLSRALTGQPVNLLKIRQPFVPPKPNEFESAYSIFISRAQLGT